MSFGSGLSEKDAIGDVQDVAGDMGDLSRVGASHSEQAYKMFKHAGKPSLQYWNSILSADNEALNEILGPEVNRINEAYAAPLRSIAENAPRGGGTVSAVGNLQEGKARAMSNLFGSVRPMAADKLSGLAGLFGGVSEGFGSQSISAKAGQGQLNLGALGAISAGRARTSDFWGSIGEGAGSLLGGIFGG